MKRRKFVKNLSALSTGFIVMPNTIIAKNDHENKGNVLKGFVVSDAHFGWNNKTQPSVEKQLLMMQKIREKFPDLDVFIDTGDAHHNGREMDQHRGDWTDYLANQANPIPFYYVPGNHEIAHTHNVDPEFRCNRLGSLSFRPYYSWDLMGIHFISMPELIRAVYITKELIDWVKLDLEINKNKTTILLSHNNIVGTTGPFAEGYRGLVNSKEILGLIEQYPNVVAWMHGHNHNYEIIEKNNRLFVSNGRIGGFDPSKGNHGLGGIYFEVQNNGLDVKCYSVEFDRFLDEFAGEEFSKSLRFSSSLNPSALPEYSYGKGSAIDGEKIPVFHHHANHNGKTELFLAGASGNVFNDDPEFKFHMIRKNNKGGHWQLMGSSVSNSQKSYEFLDPGLKIKKSNTKEPVILTIARKGHNEYTYYRVAPERAFKAQIEMDALSGGQEVKATINLYNSNGELVKEYPGEKWKLTPGKNIKTFFTDKLKAEDYNKSIYNNKNSDYLLNISVNVEFTNLIEDIEVKKVALSLKDSGTKTMNPAIVYQETEFKATGVFNERQFRKIDLPNPIGSREIIEMKAEGNGLLTWLIRHRGWDWQVRNAAINDIGNMLQISSLRNEWSHKKEIVIVPAMQTDIPYLHKTRNIISLNVGLMNRGTSNLSVKVGETIGEIGELEFYTSKAPSKIAGCKNWKMNGKNLICWVEQGAKVLLEFHEE